MEFQYSLRNQDDEEIEKGKIDFCPAKEFTASFLERKFSADDVFWISCWNGVHRFGICQREKPIRYVCIW